MNGKWDESDIVAGVILFLCFVVLIPMTLHFIDWLREGK